MASNGVDETLVGLVLALSLFLCLIGEAGSEDICLSVSFCLTSSFHLLAQKYKIL